MKAPTNAILYGTAMLSFSAPFVVGFGTGYYGANVYGSGVIVAQPYVPAVSHSSGGYAPDRSPLFKQDEDRTEIRLRQQRQIEAVLLAFLHTQD